MADRGERPVVNGMEQADHAEDGPRMPDPEAIRHWTMTFYVMAIFFSINHAAVTTPIGYASSNLGSDTGNVSLAVLYGACMVSALLFGPAASSMLGPKKGLVFSMFCYVCYTGFFAGSLFQEKESAEQRAVAVLGSAIGGIGAGCMWTCQGAFFGNCCEYLAEAKVVSREEVSNKLAASFAMWYLGLECALKVLFSILQQTTGASTAALFMVYAVIALLAMIGLAMSYDAPPKTVTRAPFCAKAAATFSLWSDAKIWLICGSNIAFGFAAAYLNGFINAIPLHTALEAATGNPEIAGQIIGYLGAIICIIAVITSKVMEIVVSITRSKTPVVAIGSACFLAMAVLSKIGYPNGEGIAGWGWGILIFHILQGVGRGVYESTNKAVFADLFSGPNIAGAMANAMVQNTASSSVGFIINSQGGSKSLAWLLLGFAIFTVPALMVAKQLKQAEENKQSNPIDVSLQ